MTKEHFGSLFILFVGLYALSQSVWLPMGTLTKPGPGVFPFILSALLCVVGALLLVSERGKEKIGWKGFARQAKPWQIVFLTLVFILIFERIGYLATSSLYLFILFLWVCRFRVGPAVGLTASLVAASWYLFAKILGLQLPVGPWGL